MSKEHEERRKEILDSSERLFRLKGYERCTVNDILAAVGIAKGTFYHYFKSKEEVLDAVIARYTDIMAARTAAIHKLEGIGPTEKLRRAFLAMQMADRLDEETLQDLHKPENALLHQKTLQRVVTVMAPALAGIIEEGIEEKAWRCRYPLPYMRIFLASALTLMDEGIFELEAGAEMRIMAALISVLEKMLEVPEDSLRQLLGQNRG